MENIQLSLRWKGDVQNFINHGLFKQEFKKNILRTWKIIRISIWLWYEQDEWTIQHGGYELIMGSFKG